MLGRFVLERREVVYRLGGVDPEEGVDVYDLVKYLNKFDDLVRLTVREAGYDGDLQIRVRPFKEGSFLTEFVIEGGLVDFLTSDNVDAVLKALEILGLVKLGASGIPRVVRAVRGFTDKFRKNDDGTFTYGSGDDAVTVDAPTHNAMQNPKIAELYSSVAVGPVSEFNGVVHQVNIYMRDRGREDEGLSSGATFTREDSADYATYTKTAVAADELEYKERVLVNKGIWLRPVSGSYGGAERGYSFSFGVGEDAMTYKQVRIEDEEFLDRLAAGEVRFTAGDLLQADLEVTEREHKSGVKKASYKILKVVDYRPLESPRQGTFADYIKGSSDSS